MAQTGERILVVDDDRTLLTYLKAVLGREGCRVCTAVDALQETMPVPVVVYSGLSRERAGRLVPAGRGALLVQKPGTPDDVLAAVRSLLGSH